jgi:hypothetical protein
MSGVLPSVTHPDIELKRDFHDRTVSVRRSRVGCVGGGFRRFANHGWQCGGRLEQHACRIAGIAVGADYIFSPRTIAGFALAGGGANFSVANGGVGRSDPGRRVREAHRGRRLHLRRAGLWAGRASRRTARSPASIVSTPSSMRMPRKRCPQDEERWARCVPTRPKPRCAEREKIDERTTRCFPSSLIRKNILVRTSPKSLHIHRCLVLSRRGGSRSSRTLGAGCGGRDARLTKRADADGEVVWF